MGHRQIESRRCSTKTFLRGGFGRQRRVRLKRGGGCAACEWRAPARLLIPMRARSLGRRGHRTASPFAAGGRRDEAGDQGLHHAGAARPFLSGAEAGLVIEGSSERRMCRYERASRGSSAGYCEAALHFIGTLRCRPTSLRHNHFVLWRRPAIWRCDTPEWPGKKRTRTCTGDDRSIDP